MARIRSIKPEIWADEDLAACSFVARLLFVGLITRADDEGRFRAHPNLLRGEVFPYDGLTAKEVTKLLGELAKRHLVTLYTVAGQSYGTFKSGAWKRHQKINRPYPSSIPPPPAATSCAHDSFTERSVNEHGTIPERSVDAHGSFSSGEERSGVEGIFTDSLRSSGADAPGAEGKDEQVGGEDQPPPPPAQLDLVRVKKLTPQQEAVELVTAVYAEAGVEPPAPSLLALWRREIGDTAKLVETLRHLAVTGHLGKGTGYVGTTVKRVAAGEPIGGNNGQAHPAGPRPVPTAAEPYPSTPHGAVDAATGEFYDAPTDTWRPPLRGDVRRNGKVYDGAGWVDSLELAS